MLPSRTIIQFALLCLGVAVGCGSRTLRAGDGDAGDLPDVTPREDISLRLDIPVRDVPPPFDRPLFPDRPPPPDVPLVLPDSGSLEGLTCTRPIEVPGDIDSLLGVIPSRAVERRNVCGSMTVAWSAVQYYRTVVAPGQTLVVTGATTRGSGAMIRILESCSVLTCLAQSTLTGGSPTTATARFTNSGPSTRVVIFAVGTIEVTPTADLISTSVRFVNPSPNGPCSGAISLTPGVTVPGQNTLGAQEIATPCPGVGGSALPALWYRVSVPAGAVLSLLAQPTSMPFGGLQGRVYTGCGGMCLPSSASVGPDARSLALRWTNAAASAQQVYIGIVGSSPTIPVTFDVTATFAAAPSNTTCARATPVMEGTLLTAQDQSASSTSVMPCAGMVATGLTNALFYAADVPAGQTLVASATSMIPGRAAYTMRVLNSCDESLCLAASTAPSTQAVVAWTNTSMATRRVIFNVTAAAPTNTSPFDLSVRIRPTPTNTTCAGAARITPGTLRGERLVVAREGNGTCLAFGAMSQPVLYYVATVGGGERIQVTATRTGSAAFQPLVRIIESCASMTCLASSSGAPTTSWANPSMGPRDVVVMVSSLSPSPDATFDLTFSGGTPPYRAEVIPSACDTLAASTVVASAIGDDVGSASIPLPFPLRYFGGPMAAWSVSTNGYLQLWPMSGVSTGALGASELPNPGAPPSMVAPFWDDLEVDVSSASIRWQDFTAPARHLTVEWNNVRFCCGGGVADRLTFQAKLFAGSNVIEFHYCSLGSSPRSSGQSASIGIQDSSGAAGVSYAHRRVMAVSPAVGVRFTPSM